MKLKYFKFIFTLLLLAFSKIICSQSTVNGNIENVGMYYNGTALEITYDLMSENKNDCYIISVYIYKSPDILIDSKSFSGDIGSDIKQGKSKKIYWNAQADGVVLNNDVFVEVRANPKLNIPLGKHLLKSAIIPGWGNYRIGNGKAYFLYGVATYGSLAASLYYNSTASKSYDQYKNSFDIEQSDKLFNKSINERNISIGLSALTAGIWAYDMYKVYRSVEKIKNNGVNKHNSTYYFEKSIAFTTGRSKVKKIDTRTPYQIAIENGNVAFLNNNYSEALIAYKKALEAKQGDLNAQQKVKTTENIIAEIKAKEAKYIRDMFVADSLFSANKYDDAILFYKEMLVFKPNEKYPQQKINAANAVIAENKKQIQYNELIVKADNQYKNKEYDVAIATYKEALKLYPANEYTDKMLSKAIQEKTDKQYNDCITKADNYFKSKDYFNATIFYNNALEIKPSEKYPQTKLNDIDNQLAFLAKQKIDKEYAELIQKGKASYSQQNYEAADEYFSKARLLKPSEDYPTTMINNCAEMIEEREQRILDDDYKTALSNGDVAYKKSEYDKAKAFYQEASNLKPSESYPKAKIAEINKLFESSANNLPALFKRCSPAVFFVFTIDDISNYQEELSVSQGSGFFIKSTGIGVTNFHVYNGIDKAYIRTEDGEFYEIEKTLDKSIDTENDYIIFKVKNPVNIVFNYVSIANKEPEVGESVFAIGNPEGLSKTLSDGIVSSFRGDNKDLIQTTTPITHGSSGGPLFNMKGEVIGITTMGKSDGNLNFAVNIKLLNLWKYK